MSEDIQLTTSYSSVDWQRLTETWKVTMYSTYPGTEKPLDLPSNTYNSMARKKSFDEVMEEVLEDRAEAWEKLADL